MNKQYSKEEKNELIAEYQQWMCFVNHKVNFGGEDIFLDSKRRRECIHIVNVSTFKL